MQRVEHFEVNSPKNVYFLSPVLDDPRFEGFVSDDGRFLNTVPHPITTRNWKVQRVSKGWVPPKLSGRVRKFNDFPCVDFGVPAFSAKAATALLDMLTPNGELLPIISNQGEYFAYNTTTVADVLDLRRSSVNWLRKPFVAMEIDRHEFIAKAIDELLIFRIPERGRDVYVTQRFVDRVYAHQLRGFDFSLVFPLPEHVSWRRLAKDRRLEPDRSGGRLPKAESVVIRLMTGTDSKPSIAMIRRANKVAQQLNDLLVDPNSDAPAIGNFEELETDYVGECRLVLSCPDAKALKKKLGTWLPNLDWAAGYEVLEVPSRW